MSISNTWFTAGLRQDPSLQRKLMRESANIAMPGASLTITPSTPASAGPENVGGQIEVNHAGHRSMRAALNSAGIGMAPPREPDASNTFSSDASALFSALDSGDTTTATAVAEKIKNVLDAFDALRQDITSAPTAIPVADTETAVSTEDTSDTTAADTSASDGAASAESTTSANTAETDFIASLKRIISEVGAGDFETAKTDAGKLSDTLASLTPARIGGERLERSPMIGDIMGQVGALLASVEHGDDESAEALASSLQSALPDLDMSATTAEGKDFDTDLAALLNAVEAGNMESAKSAAKTIEAALSLDISQNATTTAQDADGSIAETSIDAALTSLDALGSSQTEASQADTFVQSLKDLLEALRLGTNIDQKIKSVVDAYAVDQTPAAADQTTSTEITAT